MESSPAYVAAYVALGTRRIGESTSKTILISQEHPDMLGYSGAIPDATAPPTRRNLAVQKLRICFTLVTCM